MDKQDFLKLLDKYLEGNASEEEIKFLENYYNSFQHSRQWNESELGSSKDVESRLLLNINKTIAEQGLALVIPIYRRVWFRIAASVIVLLGLGTIVWLSLYRSNVQPIATRKSNNSLKHIQISNQTVLILEDGKTITLDNVNNGIVAHQGNTYVRKLDSQIVYEHSSTSSSQNGSSISYNTVSIPKGRHYRVVLPDGSKVWLNAASTIRFPTVFGAKERKVELGGEAYFEVEKDPRRPFQVYASGFNGNNEKGALVEVLGTHFNINAYGDERVLKTTLLEGRVKVTPVNSSGQIQQNSHVLLPGQQAEIEAGALITEDFNVQTVDVTEVMAWKNDLFNFNTADIQTIMRQIARWYNVEVVYEGTIPQKNFSGKINQNTELTTVLKILEQSGIHFDLEGKRIIVRP